MRLICESHALLVAHTEAGLLLLAQCPPAHQALLRAGLPQRQRVQSTRHAGDAGIGTDLDLHVQVSSRLIRSKGHSELIVQYLNYNDIS
jgi:hypothetical protein